MVVFHKFSVWPKFYCIIYCAVYSIALYCIYRESIAQWKKFTSPAVVGCGMSKISYNEWGINLEMWKRHPMFWTFINIGVAEEIPLQQQVATIAKQLHYSLSFKFNAMTMCNDKDYVNNGHFTWPVQAEYTISRGSDGLQGGTYFNTGTYMCVLLYIYIYELRIWLPWPISYRVFLYSIFAHNTHTYTYIYIYACICTYVYMDSTCIDYKMFNIVLSRWFVWE